MEKKSISTFILFLLLFFSIGSSFASQSTIVVEASSSVVELLEEEVKSENVQDHLIATELESKSTKSEYIKSEKFLKPSQDLGVDNPPPERA